MKKYLAIMTGILIPLFLFCLETNAGVRAPKKECHAYVVMDAGSGRVLFGQDHNKKIYPASTAKLMTAIVCVENGDVDSRIKTRSDVVNNTEPGTYALGLGSGITFTFRDLLHLSLLSSASDATDSLAAGVFGSKKACVKKMNEKCQELGLGKTSFDNPVGSDIGSGFNHTYSTAVEMARVTRYAMAVPLIRSTVAKASYTTRAGQDLSVSTTNWFLRGIAGYDDDTYEIIGSKSGTTNAAGHVFIATAMDKKGHEVICAFFGNVSKESTFNSIRSLFDYTFKQYKKGKLNLTCSDYDVRNSRAFGPLHDLYAVCGCYPENVSGKFDQNRPVTRAEMARMLRGVCGLKGNTIVNSFVTSNKDGKVTALRLAMLADELCPAHLSDDLIDEYLKKGKDAEDLSDEEKSAFAAFIGKKLAPQASCLDPDQVITRKQALLFADRFSDYQVSHAISNPDAPELFMGEDGALQAAKIPFNLKWNKALKKQAAAKEQAE